MLNFAYLLAILAILKTASQVLAIKLDRLEKLTREDLIKLDYDVSDYYRETYEDLDRSNTTFDEQLYKSIRSIRHTVVVNLLDYYYTDEDVMFKSQGAVVNPNLCKSDLEVLVNIAEDYYNQDRRQQVPISAVDFLESYGRDEAGALNGNFIWWGSASSCERAKISSIAVAKYRKQSNGDNPIRSRYCVAHLRAKYWPLDDKYFGDRVGLRVGVCLPESCHSLQFFQDEVMRKQVDFLARANLRPPFNGDRYDISYLYCLPDEDSTFRKWDFGMKAFCVFIGIWLSFLLYASLQYNQRVQVIKTLRKSVDIRVIINKDKRNGNSTEIGEDQIETNETVVSQGKRQKSNTGTQGASQRIDLVKCFALQGNLSYLFNNTPSTATSKSQSEAADGKTQTHLSSQHLKPIGNRKVSASNEALLRELQSEQQAENDGTSQSNTPNLIRRISKRVNVDIFDGIKVIATNYIVVGHTMTLFFGLSTDIRFGHERMLEVTTIALLNALQVVSLFYIMTGALLTYFTFTKAKPHQIYQPTVWLLIVIGRYVRLMPSYLLVFWFARHVSSNLGSGPFWLDYRTDALEARGHCATQNWYTMLTLSSADIKIPLDCVPQTWYLSNDFRTLMILPPYIILLSLNRTAGYAAIWSTFAISSLKFVKILREANIDYKILLMWHPHVYSLLFDRLHDAYTSLAVRLSSYLLGVGLGHLLYRYESKQIKEWPGWFRRYAMKLALLNCCLLFFGPNLMSWPIVNQYLPAREDMDSSLVVILIPFFKTSMEISICVVLLGLLTGGGFKWVRNFLTSDLMLTCSKISYCVFLVHTEVLYKVPVLKFESNYWYLFTYGLMFIIVSNVAALLIHSLYEMPVNNMIRHFMRKAIKVVDS